MAIHYALAKFPEKHAKAIARDAPISTKHCIEICKNLKGKNIARSKKILEDVISLKKAIPFKRATFDLGHKKGMGPGRFPVKASQVVLTLLKSAEANAQLKGLNSNDLIVYHMAAQQASRPWHYGRKGRAKMKRSHVEIVLAEKQADVKKEKTAASPSETKEKKSSSQKETKAKNQN